MRNELNLPKQAMILAAGRGSRLRPLTDRIPKCMVSLNGKPILQQSIEWLRSFGVTDLVVNLYHLPDVVVEHFGDGRQWGVHITYAMEKEALGTAGGVRNVASLFQSPFFVWYGDNLSTCDLARLFACHRQKGGAVTIAVHYRDDPTQGGIVGLDEDDRVIRFVEKPSLAQAFSHWVNSGIYVLDPSVVASIPAAGNPDFGCDVFPALLEAGAYLPRSVDRRSQPSPVG